MKSRFLLPVARLTAAAACALAVVGAPAAMALPPMPIPTFTTVAASPSALTTGAPVVYTVTVSPAPSGGTVALIDNGQPVGGCSALALTAGTATCTTTASSEAALHYIYATYSGLGMHMPSSAWALVPVVGSSTTVVTASPKLADPGAAMTYVATVSPRPQWGGMGSACSSFGGCGAPVETVSFAVDGEAVADCAKRPVDLVTGVATCKTAVAPAAGGGHVVTASYTGDEDTYLTASQGTDDFQVTAPVVSLSTSVLPFGTVAVGASGTQQVTATNSGNRTLSLGTATAGGAFSITANSCANATLAPGEICVVTLVFAPAAGGAAAATLTVNTDAGSPTVALSGTGAAAATPPTGATLPPNAKTTFTATTSSAPGAPSTVTVPLRCPDGVACTLDGTVVISTSDLLKSKTVRAAAVDTQTVARFTGVRVAAGKVREIKLKLSPAFIKAAQKRGIRLIHATLTVNTTFTDGSKATRQEKVKIRIPKAVKKKQAAPKQSPRFTG